MKIDLISCNLLIHLEIASCERACDLQETVNHGKKLRSLKDVGARIERVRAAAQCAAQKDSLGAFIPERERSSTFGMHEQRDLVEKSKYVREGGWGILV